MSDLYPQISQISADYFEPYRRLASASRGIATIRR